MEQSQPKTEWKWGALAALAMTIIALYPQINLWMARGSAWQGSYVVSQGDESAYSGYINALIEGRPRRNDPNTGRDDAPGAPQPESLFSIQFIPAYAIALPARWLRFSASTAFIALIALAAMGASMAIFVLISSVTGDSRVGAAGAVFVLCLGTLVAMQGEARALLGGAPTYSFFPFLRRYQPALPFPLFFVFCFLVWRGLNAETLRTAMISTAAAGVVIATLVFSYFYLWTAALAWLTGCAIFWLVWQPAERKRILLVCGVVFGCAASALGPYFFLLSHRDPNMDQVQLLTLTHAPDLLRVSELISLMALIALVPGIRRGLFDNRRAALFVASLALMPLLVFNQQVITGRSMQPLHYELFIANYVSLLVIVMTTTVLIQNRAATAKKIPGRAIALAGLLALGWGFIETTGATKRDVALAKVRDDAMPVSNRFVELAKSDGLNPRQDAVDPRAIVFSSTLPVADWLPTTAPQASLWALHMDAFPGATAAERKERFYQYMYYSGISDKDLEKAISEGRFAIMAALFGVERVIPGLVPGEKPIPLDEMRSAAQAYRQYIAFYSRDRASHPTLSYVVVPTEAAPDLSNVDRWYQRDAGEKAGIFTIYRVKLREAVAAGQ
jgi:hypothetical protein